MIPNATVTITSAARGTSTVAKSNDAGFFLASYLLPGEYTLTAEADGFKKYVQEKFELRVGDTLSFDVKLVVGTITEIVTVESSTTLETTTGSAGYVVDAKRINELPIPHGEPYKLLGLATGTGYARDPRLDRPYEPTHIVGYTIDGTRANRSDLTIDGAPSTATANNGEVISTFVPPQDLVQEFKVQTATFDAASGNTEGGVTSLQIKSGTRDFHGTLGYVMARPSMFANDFFANRNGQPRADFFYHRFGGTATGPVWIPKVYDGRNGTFFTYGYEGIREARPRNNGVFSTPTLCMLGRATCNGVQQIGNFSELLPAGANFTIYDPFSASGTPTSYTRTAFPNNIIPANLINPIAANLVNMYWPDPTSAPTNATQFTGNFQQPNMVENAVYDSNTIRVDHSFNEQHKIFGRTSWYERYSDYNNYFHNIATGNNFYFISRQAIFDHVWTMSSSMILNSRYAYNRFIRGDTANPAGAGFDLTSVGFPPSYANLIDPGILHFPRIVLGASSGANVYQGTATPGEDRPNDLHSLASTLTKIIGSHAVRGGVEFRSYRENRTPMANDMTGSFRFDNTYTKAGNTVSNSNQVGHAFAAFLLGVPSAGTIAVNDSYAEQSTTWGFFAHDDWTVNRKLTLNIGLRWEFETPLTERFNRAVRQFDPTFVQPIQAAAQAAYAASAGTPEVPASAFTVMGGMTFANVNGNPRGLYNTPKVNLMPRLGFAYSWDSKTVIRGGYGIFFGFLGQRQGDVVQSGFNAVTNMDITTNNGFAFNETLSNPFTAGLVQPTGSSAGGVTFLGQGITVVNPKPSMPYMQRWELGFQREVGWGFVAEAAYVGNRGTHLEVFSGQGTTLANINSTPLQYLSTSPTRDEVLRLYLTQNITNPFQGLMPTGVAISNGATIARERLLRPFPEFDTIRTQRYDGYSWYHSLQMSLQKRFKHGYTVNASYTFSKFQQATELLNDLDAQPWEGISDQDFPHRITVSWIYELPFGRGKWLGSNANGLLNRIIGDWQLQGYWQYQSGNPLQAFGNRIYNGNLKDIVFPKGQQTVEQWFDTTGFVALRAGSTIQTVPGTGTFAAGGTPIWVDFNDPCKNSFNAVTCPGTPLTNPTGWNRDPGVQLDHNVRTFPLRFSWLRSDTINNWDLSLLKNVAITESTKFQFRWEVLNALNHPWFPAANVDPTSGSFGQAIASTQRNYARRMQLHFKFVF